MASNYDFLKECLSQQLGEYELLLSMYPDHGEIVLGDKQVINQINKFLCDETETIPNPLNIKLNILINDLKFDLFFTLPTAYPQEKPDIYIRCNLLNRYDECKLNAGVSQHIKDNHIGEVCLYTAISWLQENVDQFTASTHTSNVVVNREPKRTKEEYARLWVYSHHIYSKKQREDIVKQARELKLTGFSLPGKPGLVCLEGSHDDCKQWVRNIKLLSWKKIVIKKSEIFPHSKEKTYKKFLHFEEMNSNISELSKYLSKIGLHHTINELFGLTHYD